MRAQFIHTRESYSGPSVPPDGTMIENEDGGVTVWVGGMGWRESPSDQSRRIGAEMRAACKSSK